MTWGVNWPWLEIVVNWVRGNVRLMIRDVPVAMGLPDRGYSTEPPIPHREPVVAAFNVRVYAEGERTV